MSWKWKNSLESVDTASSSWKLGSMNTSCMLIVLRRVVELPEFNFLNSHIHILWNVQEQN